MPSCDVVPDSTDLGTNRSNLRSITDIDDRFEPIQISSNVSWVNISSDISSLDVASLWDLYFFFEMLQTIAKHINIYVNESHRWEKERDSKVRSRPAVKLGLGWIEKNQLNPILNSGWGWVDSSQPELNPKSSWVAWTQFLKIVYLLIYTEFSCKLNSNSISKNRIITCMHEIFAQTEFSRTLI